MGHIIRNKHLEVHLDLPHENYQQSRFDWTGKITTVQYKGICLTGTELAQSTDNNSGRGLYNEFGFKLPLGFEEIKQGEWFHKIGVGLLQKDGSKYDFLKAYKIRPANFDMRVSKHKVTFICQSELSSGYAYLLKKTIQLDKVGWDICYSLENTGTKTIVTNEYTHNFIALNGAPTDSSYHLSFPFDIRQGSFDETINPEELVSIGTRDIQFLAQPTKPFFFSYMSGVEPVAAQWTLENKSIGITLSEKGDFQTQNVCLWGAGHVISPELFKEIHLPAGQSTTWTRVYRIGL
jgi:hypothetical protein